MTANELYKELYNLYGPVTRARDCFLYTKKGVRLTDLFLENGRAILGWDGKSSFTMLKNTLNRGQTGGFICEENERLEKAVSELLTSKRKIFFFSNKMDALKAGLAISPESTSFWKPWNSNDAKNCACDATCDVGCDITCDVSSVVITPPLPWTDSIYILAVKTEEIAAKMVEGRLNKFYKEICLEEQEFIMDNIINSPEWLGYALIDTGYITPSSGTKNIGDLSMYERLLVILSANGSNTIVEIPKSMYGLNIGANWQAVDNRIATYYCTFRIEANGNITIIYSGYSFNTTTNDYPREYGISKIYGYKY